MYVCIILILLLVQIFLQVDLYNSKPPSIYTEQF